MSYSSGTKQRLTLLEDELRKAIAERDATRVVLEQASQHAQTGMAAMLILAGYAALADRFTPEEDGLWRHECAAVDGGGWLNLALTQRTCNGCGVKSPTAAALFVSGDESIAALRQLGFPDREDGNVDGDVVLQHCDLIQTPTGFLFRLRRPLRLSAPQRPANSDDQQAGA